jgi:hypothetical protein
LPINAATGSSAFVIENSTTYMLNSTGQWVKGVAEAGTNGLSAYEIAVINGFIGSEIDWLNSLKGENGYTPKKGIDYFTNEDKDEIANTILNLLPKWNGGEY